MARSLEHEIYKSKVIKCRCGKTIGTTAFDSQVLILESSRIAVYNYLCWKCVCGKNDFVLAPLLPDVPKTIDNTVPDIQTITHRSAALKKKMQKLGYKPKQKQTDYQPNEQTAAT